MPQTVELSGGFADGRKLIVSDEIFCRGRLRLLSSVADLTQWGPECLMNPPPTKMYTYARCEKTPWVWELEGTSDVD